VLTDTLRAAARAGVEARLIRSAYDVDTVEDLRRLERDLATASAEVAPNIRRWMDEGR
jgi:GTP:adenosylcobinamide-phosphate guanylyltransferase